MRDNPLQFAVVREDPLVVVDVLRRRPARRALLVASGGCTALTVQAVFPDLELTLLDPNPAQLDHVRAKIEALELPEAERKRRFNVEDDDPRGLSQCGNFESLFRGLREFLCDFVVDRDTMRRLFDEPGKIAEAPSLLFDHAYWSVAFETFFFDRLLETMFGPDATQHAAPGSYPTYFRRAFERGLVRDDAAKNPFLHHVLLGRYLCDEPSLPHFLRVPAPEYRFELVEGRLDAFELTGFELVDLSNVPDWMGPDDVRALFRKVGAEMRAGSTVVWRQLNNERDLEAELRPAFTFDTTWQDDLLRRDRSLFYSSVHVGVRS